MLGSVTYVWTRRINSSLALIFTTLIGPHEVLNGALRGREHALYDEIEHCDELSAVSSTEETSRGPTRKPASGPAP